MNNEGKIKLITLITIVLILIVILLGIIAYSMIKNEDNNEYGNPNVEGNTISSEIGQNSIENFEFEFLKLENKKQNMIYSPLSIKYALSMLKDGANGDTKKEIENILKDLEITKYNNIDKNLSLANAVYIRDSYSKKVNEDYISIMKQKYNAEIKYDAFENAKTVNKWIENKTLGLIENMLKDEMFETNPNLEMLLINALAIDMEWENRFETNNTHGKTFYLENGTKMEATTMNKETSADNISYFIENDITVLSMDLKQYKDTQLEILTIMPDKNLEEYVKNIDENKINEISNKLIKASKPKNGIKISIPKFKFEYDLELKEDLMSLGIKEAFDDVKADFSNMTNAEEGLYVSDALHKANIEFSEEGIKAAAVTVFAMTDKAIMIEKTKPIEINIDRPFMFIIRDKQTKENWFVGTVYKPNSWEEDAKNYY